MTDDGFRIGELVDREVFVQKKHVGTIVGERYHPNEERVSSMRIQVAPDVAEEFMRKPAEFAPLSKELLHSIQNDGSVKLSKSMRELQRRWRNTVRNDEQLYSPDELLDRAVLDSQGLEIGVIASWRGETGCLSPRLERPPSVRRESCERSDPSGMWRRWFRLSGTPSMRPARPC